MKKIIYLLLLIVFLPACSFVFFKAQKPMADLNSQPADINLNQPITADNINSAPAISRIDPIYLEFNLQPSPDYHIHKFIKSHQGDRVVYSETKAIFNEETEFNDGKVSYLIYLKTPNGKPQLIANEDLELPRDIGDIPLRWSSSDDLIFFENWAIYGGGPGPGGQLTVYNLANPNKGIYGLSSETYLFDETDKYIAYLEDSNKTIRFCYPEGAESNEGKLIVKDILADKIIYTQEDGGVDYHLAEFKNGQLSFSSNAVVEDNSQEQENYCAKETEPTIHYIYDVKTSQLTKK